MEKEIDLNELNTSKNYSLDNSKAINFRQNNPDNLNVSVMSERTNKSVNKVIEKFNTKNREMDDLRNNDKIFTLIDRSKETLNDNDFSFRNSEIVEDKAYSEYVVPTDAKNRAEQNNNSYYKGTLDGFINKVGLSFYTISVFVLFAILIMVDGGEMTVISLLVTKLGSSWNLSDKEKGVMGSSVFIGFFAGTLFSGKIADVSGRKPIFIVGNIIVTVFAVLSALSPSYLWFTLFRGICGFGVGLSLPASAALCTEICPANLRGILINLLGLFFPLGEILTALIAKSLLKNHDQGWRYLLAIIAAPMTIALILSFFVRESPRFLANNKEFTKAYVEIDILLSGKTKLTEIDKFNIKQEINIASENKDITSNYFTLFSKQYLALNLSICFLLFSCSFIYYGIVFVLPEGLEHNYNKTQLNSTLYQMNFNDTRSKIDLKYLVDKSKTPYGNLNQLVDEGLKTISNVLNNSNETNTNSTKEIFHRNDLLDDLNDKDLDKVFNGVIYSALSEIPSPLIAILLVNIKFLGRRYAMAVGFIGVSIFAFFCMQFNMQLVIWASFLKFGINVPFSIGYLYVSEAFPTKIRSIALGFSNSFTRLGGIVTPILSQVLFDMNPIYPYLAFLINAVLACICAFCLQVETYGRILE